MSDEPAGNRQQKASLLPARLNGHNLTNQLQNIASNQKT
jgi:hypothetical protein